MRFACCAILAIPVLFASAASAQNTAFAMIVNGPTTLKNNGPAGTYMVTFGFGGKPANLNYRPSSPLYLAESDGTLMSFTSVNLPPGQTGQTVKMTLSCQGGKVGGTATRLAAGSMNNPFSSGGTQRPARVFVKYEGWNYDNSPSPGGIPHIGNVLNITCTP